MDRVSEHSSLPVGVAADTTDSVAEGSSETGRYAFLGEIGADALGSVWDACAIDGPLPSGQAVTIRRIDAAWQERDPAVVEAFERAVRWAMQIDDPRLLRVWDMAGGLEQFDVVTPRVDGQILGRLLRAAAERKSPIGEPIAVRIVLDLLAELELLHSVRRAHGDDPRFGGLCPSSVIVDVEGRSHLLDIGLSAVAARRIAAEMLGERALYLAPEQLDGFSDARTDVFAAGLILWEMLALRPANGGSAEAMRSKIRRGQPPHLTRVVRPGMQPVAHQLADVVAHATRPDPGERFARPAELARALSEAVEPVSHAEARLIVRWVQRSRRPKPPAEPVVSPSLRDVGWLAGLQRLAEPVVYVGPSSGFFDDEITVPRFAPLGDTAARAAGARAPLLEEDPELEIGRDSMPTLDLDRDSVEDDFPSVSPQALDARHDEGARTATASPAWLLGLVVLVFVLSGAASIGVVRLVTGGRGGPAASSGRAERRRPDEAGGAGRPHPAANRTPEPERAGAAIARTDHQRRGTTKPRSSASSAVRPRGSATRDSQIEGAPANEEDERQRRPSSSPSFTPTGI